MPLRQNILHKHTLDRLEMRIESSIGYLYIREQRQRSCSLNALLALYTEVIIKRHKKIIENLKNLKIYAKREN